MQISSECRDNFKVAIVSTMRANPGLSREQLIGLVFDFFDGCLSDLVEAGRVAIEHNASGESHMDIMSATDTR